jgi:hypothetical protein
MTTLPDTERRRSPYLLHRLVQLGLGAPLGRRRSERRFKPAVKPAGRMKWSPPKLEIPPPRRLVAGLSYYADYVTSENEELQRGLEHAGWRLEFAEGRSLPEVVEETGSDTVFMTDRRDFDHWDCFGHLGLGDEHRWRDVDELPPDIFRATVFKDMMWWTDWQLEQVQKFGAHAVVVYYDPAIAVALAPWLEPLLVRTWHSVEPSYCGDVYGTSKRRRRCILSGAVDPRKAGTVRDPYPLRTRLFESAESLGADIRPHPGYNADRCDTPDYLRCLSGYKTAVCTSSQYDFALRKIIEATACGCRVVTDLTEEMPEIDANLIRVEPGIRMDDLAEIVDEAEAGWDEEIQHLHAMAARDYYDWRRRGIELDEALQDKRRTLLK